MTKYTSKLQNKRVLILGGSSGIGFCVAEAALEYGAIVVISSSRQTKIDSAVERLKQSVPGARISGQACDLSNPDTTDDNLKVLFEFATTEGKLDHIVNTAGDSLGITGVAEVTPQKFFAAQQVRLVASMLIAKHSLTYMNKSNSSSITLTGGVNTEKPNPGWSMIAASGAGVQGLVRGLAVDLKPIRINAVAPGAVMTELWTSTFKADGQLGQMEQMYVDKSLTGEIGRPEDLAEAYLYFMKDRFVDGQILLSEGGYLLS